MNTLEDARFLLSHEAEVAIGQLMGLVLDGPRTLAESERLRNRFSPSQASALLTLASLRQQAANYIPHAEKLFFTRESLEQSTAWEIARYRARWVHKNAPMGPILDLGCGIGGDLIHLAQHRDVIAYEVDPVRACFAQANIDAMGLTDQVEIRHADWVAEQENGTLPNAAVAFVDPARRVNGKRIFNVEQMLPPLSAILSLQSVANRLCVKLMPGIQENDLPSGANVTFISHQKVCKEAMLWLNCTATAQPTKPHFSAAVHREGVWHEIDASQQVPPTGPLLEGHTLHEPDPALIRAGSFWELCTEINGWLFDPQIAYIISPGAVRHPLLQSFHILEVHSFNLKKLNQRISVLGIGSVELKKRGMPFEPESMRKRLKLIPNGRPAVIIFTRRVDQRLMIIAERRKLDESRSICK